MSFSPLARAALAALTTKPSGAGAGVPEVPAALDVGSSMVEVPGSTTCLRVETPSAVTAAGSEYSAPLGNQPAWVTRWLERNGIVAYYFTGDAGLGPTRVYRDAERDGADIWGFPILHMGKEASLEEMGVDDVPIDAVRDWLLAVTDFTAREHAARLVYTHPYGAERFFGTLRTWLDHASVLQTEGRFRWYTMTELAEFLNQRDSVRWTVLRTSPPLRTSKGSSGGVILHASHPKTLAHQTWVFPPSRCLFS